MRTIKNNLYKLDFVKLNMKKKSATDSYIYFNCLNSNGYSHLSKTLKTTKSVLFNITNRETINLNKL